MTCMTTYAGLLERESGKNILVMMEFWLGLEVSSDLGPLSLSDAVIVAAWSPDGSAILDECELVPVTKHII